MGVIVYSFISLFIKPLPMSCFTQSRESLLHIFHSFPLLSFHSQLLTLFLLYTWFFPLSVIFIFRLLLFFQFIPNVPSQIIFLCSYSIQSQLMRLPPSLFSDACNLATLHFGCNSVFIVIMFPVFLLVFWNSSFVH